MDKEKVIKGLETCAGTNNESFQDMVVCVLECPYKGHGCVDQLMFDAIALIKEQDEEVKAAYRRGLESGRTIKW